MSDSSYINTVADMAAEIISDMGNDSSLSVAYLSSWLRNNIGKLNNAIGSAIDINDNLEFYPSITNDQKDIFKWMFICQHYSNQARANLGAGAYDWSEIVEFDSRIRRVSKNEIAKTFLQLSSQCSESLKQIILYYKTNKALPLSLSSWNSLSLLYPRSDDPHQPATYPIYPLGY